ncbi:hypothetical protein JMI89_08205 [Frischella sp. Ac48]|uniref:hypothetical protein n=1 Tax=Frischella sp. Ac48 TaxID=2804531 RepID=UPI001C7DBA2D|nr:hypothetical protein [Frischella sp. Ac48]MBX4133613.1 hypothetical protein [Frischella sp. Ac48]
MQLSRLKYAVLLALLLLLSSCQDYKGMKARLVNGYQGLDAYCLFVGRINFPYLSQPYGLGKEKEYQEYYDAQTHKLNERLPVFEQVGLLNSVTAEGQDGQSYPLYSLTEEGKKYIRLSYSEEKRITYAQFCFGRREILDVTNIRDRETDFYGGRTTETIVDFTYNLYDVPEWASHPALRKIRQYNIYFNSDEMNQEGQVYLTKKDGSYYNYSTGTVIEPYLVGYYL